MPKIASALIASALALTLTGCMSNASPEVRAFEGLSNNCEPYKGGPEIDGVKVTAEKDQTPTVEFASVKPGSTVKSPLSGIKSAQTKVIREGDGPAFVGNALMKFDYSVYSSTTGAQLATSKFDGTETVTQIFDSTNTKELCDALTGVKQGSLVAFAFPATEADPEGSLFVLNIRKVYLPHANGSANSPETGFPSVVLAPKSKEPGIVQPSFAAPKEFKRSILTTGKGETVKVGDSITVHYTGWIWSDSIGDPFDSSWDQRDPQTPVTPATFELAEKNVISGFIKALDGVTVGSQVIAVMPPGDAYGEKGQGSIPGNATLIFVIDVLGKN